MIIPRLIIIGLLLIPLIPITGGILGLVKKEWAWRVAATWYAGANPSRPSRWEIAMTITGLLLILFGLGLGLFMWPRLLPLLQGL